MRIFKIFQMFTVLLMVGLMPFPVQATSISDYIWGPPNADFVRPYLNEAKIPHNVQWDDDNWSPHDWINSRGGSAEHVMEGLYDGDIIKGQYFQKKLWGKRMPILKVGRPFVELSDRDKVRVLRFVDEVYGVTRSNSEKLAPVIMVYMYNKKHPVGMYTASGWQLQ